MFPRRYYNSRLFAPRYFPKVGGAHVDVPHAWWTARPAPASYSMQRQQSGYTAPEGNASFTGQKSLPAFTAPAKKASWTGGNE